MSKVLIVHQREGMDFTSAREYGELTPIFNGGGGNPFDLPVALEVIQRAIDGAGDDDWLLPCGYTHLNMLAAVAMARRFGRLRLLLFHAGRRIYVTKEVAFGQ